MSWNTEVTDDGAYVWYKLNEASGGVVDSGTADSGTTSVFNSGISYRVSSGITGESGNHTVGFSDTSTTYGQMKLPEMDTDLATNNALTIEFIFKITSSSGRATATRYNADAGGYGFSIEVDNNKLYVDLAFVTSFFTTNIRADTGVSWSSSNWYHAVYTFSATRSRVYINGTMTNERTFSSYTWTPTTGGQAALFAGLNGGSNQSRDSEIDEIVFYRSELTAAKIKKHAAVIGLASIDVLIEPDVTDIEVEAEAPNVIAGADILVNVDPTNIDISAPSISIETGASIEAIVTDVFIEGQDTTVIATDGILIFVDSTDIQIEGHDVSLVTEQGVSIGVSSTNIDIEGKKVPGIYDALVLKLNPINYWKFTQQPDNKTILDFGSQPVDAELRLWPDPGVPPGPQISGLNYVAGISNDFGSDALYITARQVNPVEAAYVQHVVFTGLSPFVNLPDLTWEFWFKTFSLNGVFVSIDFPDTLVSGSISRNTFVLGLVNGRLGTWEHKAPTNFQRANLVQTTQTFNDGSWHHVVMTKQTVNNTVIFRTYIDEGLSNVVLSLGSMLQNVTNQRFQQNVPTGRRDTIGSTAIDVFGAAERLYDTQLTLDNFAVYPKALNLDEIIVNYRAGTGKQEALLNVVGTNIDIEGKDVALDAVINVQSTNIKITTPGVSVTDGSNLLIILNKTDIQINETTTAVSTVGNFVTINVFPTNITVNGKNNKPFTFLDEFIFIDPTSTATTARDAKELESLDFSGLVNQQTKVLTFRIGNTFDSPTSFIVSTSSSEPDVLNAVTYSYDDVEFSNTITTESILPNHITEVIYVKIDGEKLSKAGNGTFLINVGQFNG